MQIILLTLWFSYVIIVVLESYFLVDILVKFIPYYYKYIFYIYYKPKHDTKSTREVNKPEIQTEVSSEEPKMSSKIDGIESAEQIIDKKMSIPLDGINAKKVHSNDIEAHENDCCIFMQCCCPRISKSKTINFPVENDNCCLKLYKE